MSKIILLFERVSTSRELQSGFIKLTKKTLIFYLILSIAIPSIILYSLFIIPKKASASWYDDNYAYRKSLTFTHNAAVSNTKVKFDVDTTDSPDKFQADCGDTRFTDANGNLLRYYLDSAGGACDTNSTDFYVLIPSIINGSNLIYMYYGNPAASNGTEAANFSEDTTTPSGGATSFATEEKGPGPAAYWSFDDGTGTNAQDSTTNNNDGTLSGATVPTWQTEDQCVAGKCLYFSGATGYVQSTNSTGFNPTSSWTIGAWVKGNTFASDTNSRNIVAQLDGTGTGRGFLYVDASTSKAASNLGGTVVTGASTLSTNTWYYLTSVYDSSTGKVTIYTNGVAGTATSVTAEAATGAFVIGIHKGLTTGRWQGFIDEVKVYPYARSAAQILTDFNARGTILGTSATLGSNSSEALSEGLVGYWKMDESSGNRSDASGNSYTLTDTNTVTSNPGKFGNAGQFTNSNSEYLTITDKDNLSGGNVDFTLSGWVYLDSVSAVRYIASKGSSTTSNSTMEYRLYFNSSNSKFMFDVSDGTNLGSVTASTFGTPSTATWYFITAWHDSVNNKVNISINNGTPNTVSFSTGGQDTAANFYLGAGPGAASPMDGRIDEFRVYKRVLSADERTQLYNFAPGPVGYWDFEDGSGNSVTDNSTNANTGSWNGTGTTHWTPGKYGKGGNFNGTDDDVNITDPSSGTLDFGTSTSFSIGAWIKTTNTADYQLIAEKRVSTTGNSQYSLYTNQTTGTAEIKVKDTSGNAATVTSTTNVADGKWHYVFATANRTGNLILYVDGQSEGTPVSMSSIGDISNAVDLRIGARNDTSTIPFTGQIDDVKIYNYVRTQKQIVSDMNGGHPNVGSPVGSAIAHWKFDQGVDNTCSGGVNDVCNSGSGGTALDGANSGFSSPATSTSGWTQSGKFGKALIFDGSNDAITLPTSSSLRVSIPATVSLWVKLTSTNVSQGLFTTDKTTTGNHSGLWVQTDASGKVNLHYGDNTSCSISGRRTKTGNTALSLNTWYHIVGVIRGATDMSIYINGIDDEGAYAGTGGNIAYIPASGSIGWNSGCPTGTLYTTGEIDEVKLYNYDLTADEVKLDYNRNSSQVLGTISDNSSYQKGAANQEYCVPGDSTSCAAPVGRWDFENNVNDASGNANNGSWTGTGSPRYKTGKIGKAGNFNGSGDYISVGTTGFPTGTGARTFTAWIYPTSFPSAGSYQNLFHYGAYSSDQSFGVAIDSNGKVNLLLSSDSTASSLGVSLNAWNFVSVVYSGSGKTFTIYVGSTSTTVTSSGTPNTASGNGYIGIWSTSQQYYFTGQIDQVRIFNYARSVAQIAWDYNKGGPVGHWKFDECQGSVANDSSGNSNTGTITIGASGEDTIGTCNTSSTAWGSGATGKRNYSLSFDGTDDYVSMVDNDIFSFGNGTTDKPFSVGAWVKMTDATGFRIVSKATDVTGPIEWGFFTTGTGDNLALLLYDDNSATAYQLSITSNAAMTADEGGWHYYAATYDGSGSTSGFKLYRDGVQIAATAAKGASYTALSNTSALLTIGSIFKDNATYKTFANGQIDDTRIYNYALTATQIKMLYNNGAVNFAPSTGAP